jgi:hypothetical protein
MRAYVRACGVNRHACVCACGLNSRALGARLGSFYVVAGDHCSRCQSAGESRIGLS